MLFVIMTEISYLMCVLLHRIYICHKFCDKFPVFIHLFG